MKARFGSPELAMRACKPHKVPRKFHVPGQVPGLWRYTWGSYDVRRVLPCCCQTCKGSACLIRIPRLQEFWTSPTKKCS